MNITTPSLRTGLAAVLTGALLLLTGCTETPTPSPSASSPPSPAAPVPFEPQNYALGAKWVWAQFDEVKPFLAELKGGHTYVEVVLCDVRKDKQQHDWSEPDSFVKRAREVGFGSLVKLRTGRCWATPGAPKHERGQGVTESAMPGDMKVYTDFVTEAVRRYTELGVTEFAIENEVASPTFWEGSPEDYVTLARAGAAAVHAAAPDALVVDGSVSSAGSGYAVANDLLAAGRDAEAVTAYQTYYERRFGTRGGEAAINQVSTAAELRTELSRPGPTRSIAFMDALNSLFAEGVFQTRQVHFYETWQALPTTLAYIRAKTPSAVPLEIWELGIWDDDRSIPEDERTAEVVKATVIALAAGVKKVLWLPLLDNPSGRLGATLYGLVAPSGDARGSSNAFSLLSQAAFEQAPVTAVTRRGLAGAIFTSGKPTLVTWATDGQVSLPALQGASGTTLDEDTARSANNPPATAVSTQPILITTSGPIADLQEIVK